jgi:hypothetical protein
MEPITIIMVVAKFIGYDLDSLSELDIDGIYWPITN